MWFWWYMFICNLLIPIILIVFGRVLWKHCPKKVNVFYGYRTNRSMKNVDTWRFANEYCGKLWWKIGWIILVPFAAVQIPFYHNDDDTIGLVGLVISAVQIGILVASLFPTEAALKKTFDDEGNRREK